MHVIANYQQQYNIALEQVRCSFTTSPQPALIANIIHRHAQVFDISDINKYLDLQLYKYLDRHSNLQIFRSTNI